MDAKSGAMGFAGIGAILAVVAIVLQPSESGRKSGSAADQARDGIRTAVPSAGDDALFKGGLQRLESFFGVEEDGLAAALTGYRLGFVVATVPDPVESHLDWLFDAEIDALRRAYERSGCLMDGFSLPWNARQRGSPDEMAALDESGPGVFLFRGYGSGAKRLEICYMVGEEPTRGVHKRAFREALGERDKLRAMVEHDGTADSLRVLGPTFSGSSSSLRRLLDEWLVASRDRTVEIVTGTATSGKENISAFSAIRRPSSAADVAPEAASRISFGSTVHPDETLSLVLQELVKRLGLERSDVAVLKESSTEYGATAKMGGASADSSDHASNAGARAYFTVPFPMNMWSVRAAYSKDWAAQVVSIVGRSRTSPVDLQLDEDERLHETPRVQSSLTPAIVDLTMAQIACTLVNHQVKIVVLVATDVRDKLFLGVELKRRLPDLQLVTTESNLLYLRPEYNDSLRGMLVISTYPLFVRAGDWSPQSFGDQEFAFSSDGAEGVFNGTLALLSSDCLVDYHERLDFDEASSAKTRPPVWVTAVGKTSMLPVFFGRQRDSYRFKGNEDWKDYPAWRPAASSVRADARPEPTRVLAVGILLALGLVVLALAAQRLWRYRTGSELSSQLLAGLPSATTADDHAAKRRIERVSLALHRELYTTLLFLAFTGLFLPTAFLIADVHDLISEGRPSIAQVVVLLFCCVTAVTALSATVWKAVRVVRIAWRFRGDGVAFVRRAYQQRLHGRLLWAVEVVARFGIAAIGLVYAVLTFGFVVQMGCLAAKDPASFELFFHRTTLIDEQVSCLLPLFLVGSNFVLWCAWNLGRIRLLADRKASEHAGMVGSADSAFLSGTGSVRTRLFCAVPDRMAIILFAFACLLGAWLCTRFGYTLERAVFSSDISGTLSLPFFDLTLLFGSLASLFALLWAAYRFVSTWVALRTQLDRCDDPLLSSAFDRLRVTLVKDATIDLWRPASHLRLDKLSERTWKQLTTTANACMSESSLQSRISVVTGHDFSPSHLPTVAMESERGLVMAELQTIVAEANARRHGSPPESGVESAAQTSFVSMAEEFLALQFVDYVEWAIRHLRSLAMFLFGGLLLTTALLSCYPFHPQGLFKLVFLVVAVATVATLVLVIAQVNRNPLLSRISGTEPGKVTWDRTFVMNVVGFGIVPLLTLVGSEFPAVRGTVFAWIDPLLKALGKA
jgi:hypothetical protein